MYVHCCKTTVQADKAMELSVAIQAGLAEPPRLAMPGKDPEGKGRWSGELPSLPLANCDHAKVSLGFYRRKLS